ncbi:Adenylate/guanylate cyclase with Chase sensor [uncultured Desulfobacterium sp.]|uniref:Adenylate/guanylate cyclase with Chase sensor n=1 Tax=uncultured Desulfobacterium sp. TaxID=201089 RepID=A0A445N253_9BACT|nr:Adenylate/guanylate cyclase with Chase sensor [uncultured Desulfobacterium sp.]
MSRAKKALVGGLLTGIFGLVLIPFMCGLEEDTGLDLLFKLRGKRPAPSDVVIVTLDKESALSLGLPPEPYKWPRSLHARLVDNLVEKGVAAIAFDMIFKEPGTVEMDNLFAQAIRGAGNVVLCEQIDGDILPLTDHNGVRTAELKIESIIETIPSIADAAIALAPFPLPKVPVKISQYWNFKHGAGDIPTFPVITFQVFALKEYDNLLRILKKYDPALTDSLPKEKNDAISDKQIQSLILTLRDTFRREPGLADKVLEGLEKELASADSGKNHSVLRSILEMYRAEDSLYLDFYGPSGTILTIPYYRLVQVPEAYFYEASLPDLRDKAVFVGLSERMRPEEKDGFYTTYSQVSGVDISGVEIAATAFANLLENRHARPFSAPAHIVTVIIWGLILGISCRFFSNIVGAIGVVGMSALYVVNAHYQFKASGLWSPIVTPIFIQAPLAYLGTALWKYVETYKEKQNARKALGYYVPGKVAEQLVKGAPDIRSSREIFEGTCLCTDMESYTTLSETLDPQSLGKLMNEYFDAVFEPVKRYKGTVSEVVGDSMIAVWPSNHLKASDRVQACLAALAINNAMHGPGNNNIVTRLPTRIGLHTGHMMVANIGAMDRYEYNPVGDIINTASRIEGLNRHLGTRILTSREVVNDLNEFMTREIGEFILSGKSRPVVIYELMCSEEEAGEREMAICKLFSLGLKAYKSQEWKEGIKIFSDIMKENGEDGPSRFYLGLCEKYENNMPGEMWDGVVRMGEK